MKKLRLQSILLFLIGVLFLSVFLSQTWGAIDTSIPNGFGSSQDISLTVPIYSEVIAMPVLHGWNPYAAHRQESGDHFIIEFLPEGQNFNNWTELMAIQGSMGKKFTIYQALEALKRMYRDIGGDEYVYYPFKEGLVDNHSFIGVFIGCARLKQNHPSGLRAGEGEYNYYMIIDGKKDLYMVYHAWRGPAYDRNRAPVDKAKMIEWVNHLEQIKLIEWKL